MTTDDLLVISPLLVAILTAIAILVVDLIKPGSMLLAAATALHRAGAHLGRDARRRGGRGAGHDPDSTAFGGAYTVNALTTFLDILFVSIVALTIMFAPDYLTPRGLPLAEFATVLVFAMTGAMLIGASTDLLLLFLGLELMVLPGYLLAAFHKTDAYSTEGAIKYFLLGSFSSAIFLFGLAFVWGITGTTLITGPNGIAAQLGAIVAGTAPLSPGLAMGLAFLTTGVAFKIAAVPFHYWTPDAYQGSPTPITGYLSVGPKIGAFALIIRLFVEALGPLSEWWLPVIIVLAAITMTLGNLVALTQDNVKRMLAYSSIAHTGYMLVGLAAYAAGQIDGPRGPALLRRRLRVHEPGRLRGHRRAPEADRRDLVARDVRRAGPPRAAARHPHDAVPAVADRHPADGGVLRQGLRDPGRGRGRRAADDPRGHRGHQRRGRRVLLPALRRVHVHARPGERGAGAAPRRARLERAGRRHGAHDPHRALPRAARRHRHGGREGRHPGLTVRRQSGSATRAAGEPGAPSSRPTSRDDPTTRSARARTSGGAGLRPWTATATPTWSAPRVRGRVRPHRRRRRH